MSNSYNHIPYQSAPITQTQLSHLAALGLLHGLQTAAPECCRVLEIGCAEANNLIPMAYRWPESQFVGIDLSSVQIESGRTLIERLQLKNIDLIAKNILDCDAPSLGQFDYIIVHGVYSWVPRLVQKHILQLIQACLSSQGLAYISYNTYPGWHSQKVLRDALRFYCQANDDEELMLALPHAAETFAKKQNHLEDAVAYFKHFFQESPNTFAQHYAKELNDFDNHHAAYIYHEYLESHNQPLYFKDFVQHLRPYALQYVCDTYLPVDTPFLFGKKVRKLLEPFEDRIERLQYLDFLLNQRFRRSLICHQKISIRENFSPLELTQLAFRGRLRSRFTANLKSQRKQRFYHYHDAKYATTLKHPVSKAVVQILTERYPSSIAYADLLQQACQRVADKSGLNYIQSLKPFYNEFYLLFADNLIQIEHKASSIAAIDWSQSLSLDALSFETLQQCGYIPTALHEAIEVQANTLEESVLHLLSPLQKNKNSTLANLSEHQIKFAMTRKNILRILKQQRRNQYTGLQRLKALSLLEGYRLKKQLYLFLDMLRDNGVLKNVT